MKYLIIIILLLISIIPIYLLGMYFYKKDTIKEPTYILRRLFLGGIFSVIIVSFISVFEIILFPKIKSIESIDNILIILFYSYILVSSVEEISKFIMIYKLGYKNKEFDQAYDIILYSIFVGLGFACLENIFYIIGNPAIETVLLRGITAVPAHISFQVIMGYYLYLSKMKNKETNILLGILIPIILHGTYDFLIFANSIILLILDAFFLIIICYIAYSKTKKIIEIDNSSLSSYCPNCGTKINYLYCSNCGYKKQ